MLEQIELPSSIDKTAVSPQIQGWIRDAQRRIEAFQDCWKKAQIEQFVAADYELVYQTLAWLLRSQPRRGNRFLEWGCGFAVVAALASTLDLDAIGIEAERDLLAQGRHTIESWNVDVELIHGDFLPSGADKLADDPTLPSLGHGVSGAYEQLGMDLDDFAIVYAYPWPGEDDFHEAVFDRYAATGAMLLLFCGPNEMLLWRKVS